MKRRTVLQLSAVLLGLSLLSSCKKYSDFQTNPNLPASATPALLLTNICYSIFYYDNTQAAFASRHLTYYERGNSAIDYGWNQGTNDNYSFDNYNLLRQVTQMDEIATETGQTQYLGLTKFFRALLYSQMTEVYGDIPYSASMQATSGNYKPTYDSQESIYKALLQELEEANNLLDDGKGRINGDIVYDGRASQWKKLVNAFRLRLLIHLSKKESNTNLDIKSQFQAIVSDPDKYPLLGSNDDNAQLVFNSTAPDNYYPTYGYLSLSTAVSMEKGFVKILKDRSDPRLFAIAAPVSGAEGVFSNYEGVDAGMTVANQQTASADASRIKARYYSDKTNEPWVLLGYAEQEFLIAEAIARNWITAGGSAQSHYENGISASMSFYAVDAAAASSYLTGALVAYNAGSALNQIAIQKYIAMFMNSGWEPFLEQRRTGIPTLAVGPGTVNNGLVPKRWMYPQTEKDNNADNVATAIQSQFSGDDNVNSSMWLIQ